LKKPPVWDKKLYAAHGVLLAAIVYDVEVTDRALQRGKCAEGNIDLGQHPTHGALYRNNLLKQFVPVVAIDWFAVWVGLRANWNSEHPPPSWQWRLLGYEGPVYGSFVHFRGGTKWLENNCF
jgi:hypothetical protein